MRYAYLKETGRYLGVYSDDFELTEDLGFINVEPVDFFRPTINASLDAWIEGLDSSQLIAAKERANKEYIKSKYEIHKVNGWNEYQDFRAQVITDINSEIITEAQAFLLEDYLKGAYNKISSTGDWKTARWVLTQLAGHELWMQPYIDAALVRVNDYITNNYDF